MAEAKLKAEKSEVYKLQIKTTRKYMLDMLLLLAAPTVMSWYYYGTRALWLICISVLSALFTQIAVGAVFKTKSYIADLSSIVTAVSIALCMPASVPWWVPCFAVIFAVAAVKMPFGDSESIMFVPAAAGIAFAAVCFPDELFSYPAIPHPVDSLAVFGSENFASGESITHMLSQGNSIGVSIVNFIDIAVGNIPGPMGTTCAVTMLGGLVFLLFRRPKGAVVSISFILTAAAFAALFPRIGTSTEISVIMELSGGMLFFAALVFASNESIAPKRLISRICYGISGGLIAMLLRRYSPLEESTAFAILLMNSVVPVFDSKIPVFGLEKKHLMKQLEQTKEEQLRLEKELEDVKKSQQEKEERAKLNALIEPKRTKMVERISQSIQNSSIAELENIPDAVETERETPIPKQEKADVPEEEEVTAPDYEEADDDIPTLQDIGEMASRYELNMLDIFTDANNGGDSDG